MQVTLTLKRYESYPNYIYADIHNAKTNELLVTASFEYCIAVSKVRGYVITNAQSVLEWIQKNTEIKPY